MNRTSDVTLPCREHPEDAGINFFAPKSILLPPYTKVVVRTNIRLMIPLGQVGNLLPHPYHAENGGVTVLGGMVDSGSVEEVEVVMIALSPTPYAINAGTPFVQMVIHNTNLDGPKFISKVAPHTARSHKLANTVGPRYNYNFNPQPAQAATKSTEKKIPDELTQDRPQGGDLVSHVGGPTSDTDDRSDDMECTIDGSSDDDCMTTYHDHNAIPMQIALSTFSGRRQYASSLAQQELDRLTNIPITGDIESRRVSDDTLLHILRQWSCDKNTYRVNIMPEGKDWVASDMFGATRSRGWREGGITTWGITKRTKQFAPVVALCNQWLRDRLHESFLGLETSSLLPANQWYWSSITLNKGFASKRHRDSNNVGPSLIRAFGNSERGDLYYWPNDPGKVDVSTLQRKHRGTLELRLPEHLAAYDGKRAHETQPFKGEDRISLIFFVARGSWNTRQR